MRAYSIFDDFDPQARETMEAAGIELTVHPLGVPRPDDGQMQAILESYDCAIIGTSQKLHPEMFARIETPKLIATASVGLDHIRVPEAKRGLIRVINTPKANAQSVAEYTVGAMLSCVKRLGEGAALYREGRNNKALFRKPEDVAGKTIGVIGAGNISTRILEYARLLGMRTLCWTRDPGRHGALLDMGVRFVGLDELAERSDVISVNLPNCEGTRGIISAPLIERMNPQAVFISVSRLETLDFAALRSKAAAHRGFYAVLDIDVAPSVVEGVQGLENMIVTPHIAGGTIETRKRMFRELAEQIAQDYRRQTGA